MARMNPYYSEEEIRKAISQLYKPGDVFEIRLITKGSKKQPSGYFKDADTLINELDHQPLNGANVYITINQLYPALYSRQQRDVFIPGANTTSDNDVDGYKWLFVDIDPVRPTGVSASDEEIKWSYDKAKIVCTYMQDLGFSKPVKAVSGNGSHLLYRINLANTDANKELLGNCLKALSMLFDDEHVKIDTVNHNAARVCKLYGTIAQKGSNTAERPHRLSHLIGDVFEPEINDIEYLKKLADILPKEQPQRPSSYNGYNSHNFDIESWLNKYGLGYKKASFHDGVKYILDECPFDSSHKAPDSMVTCSSSGAIGFKCLHNSCADKHWRDLRLMFEPNAYEYNDNDKRIEEGWAKHNRERKEPLPIVDDDVPMFQTASMIMSKPQPEREFIRTGINKLDKQMRGLERGKLSVISGLRASAKSTLLSEIILNAIDDEHTVVTYSGELSDISFMNWMMQQAAGKAHVEKSAKYEGFYYVSQDNIKKIADWMGEKFWLYNNNKSANLEVLMDGLRNKCISVKADLLIIDNLMALDVGSKNRTNELDATTKFMWDLKRLAEQCNVHVILVAHPRKAIGFLRLDDIAGTGNIGNIIDNAFIVHRVNEDFKRLSKQMFHWPDDHVLFTSHCTNVVEIAKDRDRGTCDFFIDLYYEEETKRLKNYKAENRIYGWEVAKDGFRQATLDDDVPF